MNQNSSRLVILGWTHWTKSDLAGYHAYLQKSCYKVFQNEGVWSFPKVHPFSQCQIIPDISIFLYANAISRQNSVIQYYGIKLIYSFQKVIRRRNWCFDWHIIIINMAYLVVWLAYSFDWDGSKQSLLRSLWEKVRQLEKSTPTPLQALLTIISYGTKSFWKHLLLSWMCWMVSI